MHALPLQKIRAARHYAPAAILFFLAVTIKLFLLPIPSKDFGVFLIHWVDFIHAYGLHAYGKTFSNYSPLYTYMLGVAGWIFPSLQSLYAIKAVTFAGEAVTAVYLYRLLERQRQESPLPVSPLIAALLFLLLPSVMANGALIGQCDVWYIAFLLATIYYLTSGHPYRAWIAFGIGTAFKLQTIFLSPLLLVYLLKRKHPWRCLLIMPAIYIAICLPAWFEGRPLLQLLTIYWSKFTGDGINDDAANIYLYLRQYDRLWVMTLGLLLASETAFAFAYVSYERWHTEASLKHVMLLATFFAALMPFILPGMHDRYFFAAEIFSFVLACLHPRWFIIPVLFQFSSLMVCLDWQFPHVVMWWGWPMRERLHTAMWINAAAIAMLLWLCYQQIWKKSANAE